MEKDSIKKRVLEAIETNKELIIEIGREIYKNPELGYKEFKTTEKVVKFLSELRLSVKDKIAVIGCKAVIDSGKSGPNISILGELDSVVCNDHCDAINNGAVHACGHNIQVAGMLGAALGLVKSNIISELSVKVTVIATPAEEFIELEYRDSLREKGELKYF
ncbi:MAG: hypothetical protein ACRC0V_10145 [Fusobacteriaceae bacterium]